MIPYTNQMQNIKLNIDKHRRHHKYTDGQNPTLKYCESILTFDIEVTSAWLEKGKVIPYRKGKSAEYWNELTPLSLCYIWQFSCDGIVYYGRELRDFEKVLQDIPSDLNCIIWVHNLPYEFAFLSGILEWENVFARTPHKPIKATPKKYKNIEFRCSYSLTRLSLEAWGEQIGVKKLVGNLDYDKIRTPLTELTKEELDYCEADCLVVEAGIKEYVNKYKKQREIPLTQTGTVRLETKNRLMYDEEYVKFIKSLVPYNAEEYKILQTVFAGGYTHANRYFSGEVITGLIEHYDFASSYPTVMIAEKYPMTKWIYIGKDLPDIKTFNDYAYIIKVKFKNIRCATFNTYIQYSKVKASDVVKDNGRVISASELEMYVTEQDYLTIIETYEYDEIEALEVYKSVKGYLPKKFVEYILELYGNKTRLKDVEGEEDLYMQSKQYINSLFGMAVTAIVQASVDFNKDNWTTIPLTEDMVNKKLQSLARYNPRDRRYFLSYSWGCWVTAYARRNLWKILETVDTTAVYCDTDSIFVIGENDFSWYNNEITKKLQIACEEQEIDFELTRPKTVKGKEKPLGVFDKEPNCIEFITLGAKRYVERREDGKLYLTVSGINKGAVDLLDDDISNFVDGFEFDKDADCVTKKLCTYLVDMPKTKWEDGYVSTYTHGINLRRTGYKLTLTEEYKSLIEYEDMSISDLPESFIASLRGIW